MKADFALEYDVVTVEQPHRLYLMARLRSGPAPDQQKRRPLNLSVVIDRSGSMAGDKIAFTRQAAQFLVQNLGANDRLGVVLYNEGVETLVEPEPVLNKDSIIHRIGQIKSGGMTNLSGGWLQGCSLVEKNKNDEFLNRVILMSDGLANRGVTSQAQIVALARKKAEEGISTTTMGLGADFNEDLLMEMADAGGGAFYFIESPEVTPHIFQEELRDLLSLVGQNLNISVSVTDYVTQVSQLNAYAMHTDGKRVTFSLGDIFGDEIKTLILELSIPALKDAGQREIARLYFEFDEISEAGTQRQTLEMPVVINVSPSQTPVSPNAEVRRSVLLLKAAQARRESVQAADQGQYNQASEVLKQAASAIADSKMNDPDLEEERQALIKQADDMERGSAHYDARSRKMMATQAIYTQKDRHASTQFLRAREIERILKVEPPTRKEGVIPAFLTWRKTIISLDRDLIRIGRAPQNELVMNTRNVSRFHCQIKRVEGRLLLEDLGSTNGTVINDQPLREPHALSVGDVVRIGQEQLLFHDQIEEPDLKDETQS